MGTRAVIHSDLNKVGYGKDIWVATHWDGDPDSLGQDLVNTMKEETRKWASKSWNQDAMKRGDKPDMGHIIQTVIAKASAEHHIDAMTTTSKKDFQNQYGDFAEFEYEILPDGKIKFRTLDGEFNKAKKGAWKKLKGSLSVSALIKKVGAKKLKKVV